MADRLLHLWQRCRIPLLILDIVVKLVLISAMTQGEGVEFIYRSF